MALGAPYFHNGQTATLKDPVRYVASGGKPDPNRTPLLQPSNLGEAEIDKVVVFLSSLTRTKTWVAAKLP